MSHVMDLEPLDLAATHISRACSLFAGASLLTSGATLLAPRDRAFAEDANGRGILPAKQLCDEAGEALASITPPARTVPYAAHDAVDMALARARAARDLLGGLRGRDESDEVLASLNLIDMGIEALESSRRAMVVAGEQLARAA